MIEEAIESSKSHNMYVKNSYQRISDGHFITLHTFPEDSGKRVKIHHILVNMYFEN